MINWKVRLKNPVFWMTVIPALVAFVYNALGAIGVNLPFSDAEVTRVVGMIVTALTTLGVLVDPTTAGVSDSERAMTYETPPECKRALEKQQKGEI